MEPSLTGSASAPISIGRRFFGASSSAMRCEPNSRGAVVRRSRVATIGPVGTDGAARGSAVMLRCEGRVEPAMVKAAWRGDAPEQAERDRLVPLDRPQLVGPAAPRDGRCDETR